MAANTNRPAVFLDRDGTIIEECHYLSRLEDVRLLPGAEAAIVRLRQAGYACVLVSNQSGVGRGFFSEHTLQVVHAEMMRQLEQAGAALDGVYYCTAAPAPGDSRAVELSDRKPAPGMLLRAARDLKLILSQSWIVGDSASDILAGRKAGCLGGILVRSGHDVTEALQVLGANVIVADDLEEAASTILPHLARQTA